MKGGGELPTGLGAAGNETRRACSSQWRQRFSCWSDGGAGVLGEVRKERKGEQGGGRVCFMGADRSEGGAGEGAGVWRTWERDGSCSEASASAGLGWRLRVTGTDRRARPVSEKGRE